MRILGIDPGTQVVGYGCLELALAMERSTGAESRPLAHRGRNVVDARALGIGGGGMGGGFATLAASILRLGRSDRPRSQRLERLASELEKIIRELEPDEVALEDAYCGRSVQAALRIGEARGVVLAMAGRFELRVFEYAPARVKRVVTGNGQATKDQVAGMVGQLLGFESAGVPADQTDALAVALCHAEHRRSRLIEGT